MSRTQQEREWDDEEFNGYLAANFNAGPMVDNAAEPDVESWDDANDRMVRYLTARGFTS